ncbi:hypothetical protein KAU55_00550 [Candidatus Bathyarchaeota archaeon]|nr:hypothetical protein [Candidatus Bathyarchaeota archaeon]
MTSMQTVRKRLEQLEHEASLRAKKTAFAWLETDGYVYPHKNDFRHPKHNLRMTPKEYEATMRALGYTDIIFVSWCSDKSLSNLSPERRAEVLARMKMGVNT